MKETVRCPQGQSTHNGSSSQASPCQCRTNSTARIRPHNTIVDHLSSHPLPPHPFTTIGSKGDALRSSMSRTTTDQTRNLANSRVYDLRRVPPFLIVSMERTHRWYFLSVFFSLFLLSDGQSSNTSSLDAVIRDYAFRALLRRRTGVLYPVLLPTNLSGITASVIRIRSASLWRRGLDSIDFHIPPGTITAPYVKRMVMVFQDLGNWSSSYYNVPGFSLASSVLGLLVYDASNVSSGGVRELGLRTMGNGLGDRFSVIFPDVGPPKDGNSTMRCVRFGEDGSVQLGYTTASNVCSTKGTGHFTIVVPSVVVAPPPEVVVERGRRRWRIWVIGVGGGVAGLVLVVLVVVGFVRLARKKKREDLEIQAERGEALGSVFVGSSKMPSAIMVRTQPGIENGNSSE